MSTMLSEKLNKILHKGVAIPANPTALTKELKLDERRQRALSRYYLESGSGGLAIGVHTSQFEIRETGLYKPVLELGKEEIDNFTAKNNKEIIRIAGVLGKTEQAVKEAETAADLGYNAVLLSLAAFRSESNEVIIEHCKTIADIIPLIGFYLQPAVGGRTLDTNFWREFVNIENVAAIKMAPFNRYQTYDVIRGVAESNRAEEIALYTGNDDNIIPDLLTEYAIPVGSKIIKKRFVGGLLGHWAVWTKTAVEILNKIKTASPEDIPGLLTLGIKVTDSNEAFFDVRNNFVGSIAGIHEVLRRQGFFEEINTIGTKEVLSPGQSAEIDRIYSIYPELNDDKFVAENLDRWLS
ncbi:MAG: dihydrodipicolinate synthase family protein [Melioribacteraceae bacterium]|nr:dihydrodipicolinate synthase family protein [Melioribacteraceae bacterium]